MKIHIWGALSGTEPMPGLHHTSWALEKNGFFWWFDAGENCSNMAHLKGYDVRKVKKLFISHSHADHIGGLYNLFFVMQKLNSLEERVEPLRIDTIVPDPEVVELVKKLVHVLREQSSLDITVTRTAPGVLCHCDGVLVECIRNHHIEPLPDGRGASYSFRIKAEGKTIIYSGDVKSTDDIAPFLEDGCDLLLMETGHHSAPSLCKIWKERRYAIGKVVFLHHGREILRDPAGTAGRCAVNWGEPVTIAADGMELEL